MSYPGRGWAGLGATLGQTGTNPPPCVQVYVGNVVPWLRDSYRPPIEDPMAMTAGGTWDWLGFLRECYRICPPSSSLWLNVLARRGGGLLQIEPAANTWWRLPDGRFIPMDGVQVPIHTPGLSPDVKIMVRLRGSWDLSAGTPSYPRVRIQEYEHIDCGEPLSGPWGGSSSFTGWQKWSHLECYGPGRYDPTEETPGGTGPAPVEEATWEAQGRVAVTSGGLLRWYYGRSDNEPIPQNEPAGAADKGQLQGPAADELKSRILAAASTAPDWYSGSRTWFAWVRVRTEASSFYTPRYVLLDYDVEGFAGPARVGREGKGLWCHDPSPPPWGTFFDCADVPAWDPDTGGTTDVPTRDELPPPDDGGFPGDDGTPPPPSGDGEPGDPGDPGAPGDPGGDSGMVPGDGPFVPSPEDGPGAPGGPGGDGSGRPSPVAPTGLPLALLAGGAGLLFLMTRERRR